MPNICLLRVSATRLQAMLLCLMAAGPATALDGGDPARGKEVYALRCASCHSIDFNGPGPAHGGLMGRRAGTVSDFAYSAALKASGIVWSEETLERWLSDPEKFVPGQRMWISVPDAVERRDIIAYLRTATRK